MTTPPTARLALAALLAFAPAVLAQTAAHEEPARPPAQVQKAMADLGESPIAAILDAAGPGVPPSLGGAGPDAREFNDHVTTLANPFFEGRVPGVRGNPLAADYI